MVFPMGIMNDSLMKRNSYSSIKMRRIVILEGIDKVFQKNHFLKKIIIIIIIIIKMLNMWLARPPLGFSMDG
jgi:hypothetical protein